MIDLDFFKGKIDAEQVLEALGIDIAFRRGDQIMCHCPDWYGNHSNGDANPSFGFNEEKLLFNCFVCFAGETKILTSEGSYEIKDLVGKSATVLTTGGEWVEAPILSFGQQPLMKITLTRNRQTKVIYATPEHRWFLRTGHKRTRSEAMTKELIPGHRLDWVLPKIKFRFLLGNAFDDIARQGVRHGFVFGDGTRVKNGVVAYFCGEKDEAMKEYFDGEPKQREPGVSYLRIADSTMKDLPELSADPQFLYGWLAGYFAADGCVDKRGQIILASGKREHLEHAKNVGNLLGIASFEITHQMRKGYGDEESPLYFLRFMGSTLTETFFVLPQHRERFLSNQARFAKERKGWVVKSVEESDRFETVYCAVVQQTHAFALEGYIRTGNCGGGNLIQLVKNMLNVDDKGAETWLMQQSNLEPQEGAKFADQIEAILNPYRETPIDPSYPESALFPFRKIHPYLYERGLSKGVIIEHQIGFDEEHYGIVIPHWFMGVLKGWQTRHLVEQDGEYFCPVESCNYDDKGKKKKVPKYKNTSHFPKSNTLYAYDQTMRACKERGLSTVVVVESPMTALFLKSHGFYSAMATFGHFNDSQASLLWPFEKVVFWPDNDAAGRTNAKNAIEYLSPYVNLQIADFVPGEKSDAANLHSADEILLYISQAQPAILWDANTNVGGK